MSVSISVFLIQYVFSKYEQTKFNFKFSNNIANEAQKNLYIGGLIGLISGLFLFWNSKNILVITVFFIALGVGCAYYLKQLQEQQYYFKKQKEVFILFENVEILMRAGLSLQRALLESRDLVVILKPSIERSMAYFPNTSLILENLRKEIDLPEGDILVSLLTQLNIVGIDKFEGVIQREAQRLEDIRVASEKVRIARKPYWLVISRTIPILVLFGMFIGALFTRMVTILPFDMFI